MNWILLIIAGLFEVGFATCLGKAKETTGNASMYLLYRATLTLPIGTAYAVWTGVGAVGTVLVGISLFREPVFFWRIFFLCTLIASIIGLKYVSASH
ncbi:MAG: multidrug efflux SMR transporter [Flavihumibacter sp.]